MTAGKRSRGRRGQPWTRTRARLRAAAAAAARPPSRVAEPPGGGGGGGSPRRSVLHLHLPGNGAARAQGEQRGGGGGGGVRDISIVCGLDAPRRVRRRRGEQWGRGGREEAALRGAARAAQTHHSRQGVVRAELAAAGGGGELTVADGGLRQQGAVGFGSLKYARRQETRRIPHGTPEKLQGSRSSSTTGYRIQCSPASQQ